MSMPSHRRRAGYSLIEVMTAVAVMTVGATGIVLMQGATTRATQDGYETSVAVNVASSWVERVKRDALLWTSAGNPGGTLFLGSNLDGNWFAPAPTDPEESRAADYHGWDTNDPASMRYCVDLRNARVHSLGGLPNAVRTDVRVWWYRSARGDANVVNRQLLGSDACPAGMALPDAMVSSPLIRQVYVSTITHWVDPS